MKKYEDFFDIETKKNKIVELENQLSNPELWNTPGQQSYQIQITKELNQLKEVVNIWKEVTDIISEIDTITELAQHTQDNSLNTELSNRIIKLEKIIKDIRLNTLLSKPHDTSNAILSLHAGAGGTESCDWVEMLFRMYSRWANRKGFEVEIIDTTPGEEAGIKSITFMIKGKYAYGLLKGEEGVHRLVRISPFDANKRRHTSFASVDVMPEVEEEEITIDEKDIRIDTYRASGHGGQHLQKTDSAVRIIHLPTGTIVQCQSERSQLKNKITAMKILKSKLYQLREEQELKNKQKERQEKGEIGWGRQKRSYVFMPYQLVKDNFTGVETGNVQSVLDGEIDAFIESFLEKQIS